jgi:DNA-binding transcriptional LysR family regulator
VVLRPLADFSVPFTLRLVWPRNNNSPLLAAFVKLVRECREEAEYSEKDEISSAN